MTTAAEKKRLQDEHDIMLALVKGVPDLVLPALARQQQNIHDLTITGPLIGDVTPPTINVTVVTLSTTTADIQFETNEPARFSFLDGNGTEKDSSGTAAFSTSMTASETGLTASTTYTYTLKVFDEEDNEAEQEVTFRTQDTSPPSGGGNIVSTYVHNGMTWEFSANVTAGAYMNGDPWVKAPATVVGIQPRWDGQKHGAMLNPDSRMGQGYGIVIKGDGSRETRVGYTASNNQMSKLPTTMTAGNSIVKSRWPATPYASNARPAIAACSVLTAVTTEAATTAFRPFYSGTNGATYDYSTVQANYGKLGTYAPSAGQPSQSEIEGYMAKTWLDHGANWPFRYFHPREHMKDYGRDLCTEMGIAALYVHTNASNANKDATLKGLIQWGIDLYGIAINGGEGKNVWGENGGHSQGRKWPIVFAGDMLGVSDMKDIKNRDVWFCEEHQTFVVTQAIINNGVAEVNGGECSRRKTCTAEVYTQSMLNNAEWAIRARIQTDEKDSRWTAWYRQCCTANSYYGFLLACLMQGLKATWDYDVLFDYQDRYKSVQDSRSDPSWMDSWHPWPLAMWNDHRSGL